MDLHIVVGIATRYGLDGPHIVSQWRRDFARPSRPGLGTSSLLYNGYRVNPEVKAAGAWRQPPTSSSAEVKERAELCLYSPLGRHGRLWGELYVADGEGKFITFNVGDCGRNGDGGVMTESQCRLYAMKGF